MRKEEIKIGGLYTAKISGKITTVRVEHIRERHDLRGRACTVYELTNTTTGRACQCESAQKFRGEAKTPKPTAAVSSAGFSHRKLEVNPAIVLATRAEHPGMILLFRKGQRYLSFGPDAVVVALVALGMHIDQIERVVDWSSPMANIEELPVSAAEFTHDALQESLRRLLRAGHRVAILDEVLDGAPAKREVEWVVG